MRRVFVTAGLVSLPVVLVASCLSFGDLSGGSLADARADTTQQGVWEHLAVVLTPDVEVKSYLNGATFDVRTTTEDGGAFPTSGVSPDDHGAVMGPAQGGAWRGSIDEARLFSRALSDAEIAALAKN